MYCRDQESLNWLAQCTWLMAADQYLIVLAISCIGSFRGEAHIESQASSPCGLPCGVPWTEHPDRSSPSAPVLRRAGVERRQLYRGGRHHLAVMAQAAEPHGSGRCRRKVFLRFVLVPLDPAPYVYCLGTALGAGFVFAL